jgi:cardiolipin synthase
MELFEQIVEYILSGTYWYFIIASVAVVLLENKNPVRTVAWVLLLLFLPYFGLLLYLVFGRSFKRQSRLSRKMHTQLINQTQNARNHLEPVNDSLLESYQPLIKLLEKTGAAPLSTNHSVDIYTDGKTLLADMLKDIEQAKHHIHAEYYILESDETGDAFKNALIKKAQEGVKVRLIYDDLGSWYLKRSAIREMKKAGIRLFAFFKIRFPYFTTKLNYRNHRKIVIIDGKVGYLGGFNIADRYTKGLDWGVWRDTHIRVHGNSVINLQNIFRADWSYMTKRVFKSDAYFPVSSTPNNYFMQIVGSGPDLDWQTIMQGYLHAIMHAKKYIYIQTPYFLPNESIANAIEMASLRGVDVRLMIPFRSDERIAFEASISYMENILKSGVKVLQYQNGFIHSKTMVIDGELSVVGTANMDLRSFEQNFEVNAFIYSPEKANELTSIFLNDAKSCKKLSYWRWKKRPMWRKMLQSIARLLSPAL